MKMFKILKIIFFPYFGYSENNDGIYFAHKCIYLLRKKFRSDLDKAFETGIWGGFWTNFFKLITAILVPCVSDMLSS